MGVEMTSVGSRISLNFPDILFQCIGETLSTVINPSLQKPPTNPVPLPVPLKLAGGPPPVPSPPLPTWMPTMLALGFRVFFLLAAGIAVLWIPLWLLGLTGYLSIPARAGMMAWHGHEMIFGFTVAVVAGFLLTAVRNWTNVPTPTGLPLLGLALLWTAGRLGLLLETQLPAVLPALIDLAFLPAVAFSIGFPIWKSKNWRNLGFVPLLLLLFACNLLFHWGSFSGGAFSGTPTGHESWALRLAVDIILMIVVVIGGRVIPMFTQNGVPGIKIPKTTWVEWGCLISIGVVALVEVVTGIWGASEPPWVLLSAVLSASSAGIAGVFQVLRMRHWQSLATRRTPLVWVLHLGYAWIPIGFFLKALMGVIPQILPTVPLHAFTVGTIGVLTLGMMSRVSLGHTGRKLLVGRPITAAFALVGLAAFVRVILPMLFPGSYLTLLVVAGTLWTVGFALFLGVYWPILTQPRVDGKVG